MYKDVLNERIDQMSALNNSERWEQESDNCWYLGGEVRRERRISLAVNMEAEFLDLVIGDASDRVCLAYLRFRSGPISEVK